MFGLMDKAELLVRLMKKIDEQASDCDTVESLPYWAEVIIDQIVQDFDDYREGMKEDGLS